MKQSEGGVLTITCTGSKGAESLDSFRGIHYSNVIHCVTSGSGYLEVANDKYRIEEGQLFFIRRGETVYYYPDCNDVWSYRWLGLNGDLSDLLIDACINVAKGYVVNAFDGIIEKFCAVCDKYCDDRLEYRMCNPYALSLIACIIEAHPSQRAGRVDYAAAARDYILSDLSNPNLKVAAIAEEIGISRSVLFRAFNAQYGVPPMQYIVDKRMQLAQQLICEGMRIKDVACAVGYENQLYFSTMFKKTTGISPTEFRDKNLGKIK